MNHPRYNRIFTQIPLEITMKLKPIIFLEEKDKIEYNMYAFSYKYLKVNFVTLNLIKHISYEHKPL